MSDIWNNINIYLEKVNKFPIHNFILQNESLFNELKFVLQEIKNINYIVENHYVLLCNNEENIKLAIIFFLLYILHSKNEKHKTYISIDFEYNNYNELKKKYKNLKDKFGRETALCQFGCYIENDAYIIIIDPKDITNEKNKYEITKEFFKCPAYKILHGGDGLDIPYLYEQFFNNNKNDIIQFTKNLYDTKFLCDYINLLNNKNEKCNIYSFLHSQNIMSSAKLNELLENEKKMGHIVYIYTDIHNMSKEFLKYSIYDVIYLKDLLIKILEINTIELQQIIELNRLTYLVRRNIISLGNEYKDGEHIVNGIGYLKKVYRNLLGNKNNYEIIKKLEYNNLLVLFS